MHDLKYSKITALQVFYEEGRVLMFVRLQGHTECFGDTICKHCMKLHREPSKKKVTVKVEKR